MSTLSLLMPSPSPVFRSEAALTNSALLHPPPIARGDKRVVVCTRPSQVAKKSKRIAGKMWEIHKRIQHVYIQHRGHGHETMTETTDARIEAQDM